MTSLTLYRQMAVNLATHDELASAFADDPQALEWSRDAMNFYIESLQTELSVAKGARNLVGAALADLNR